MEILRLLSPPDQCGYLPNEISTMEIRVAISTDPAWYSQILCRGWRRFGTQFFRPKCSGCSRCASLRIPVSGFRLSRSQRRNLRDNSGLMVKVQKPSITADHLDLYNRYHQDMADRKGWPVREKSPEAYRQTFVNGGYSFGREFLYFDGDRLVGVGLADVLPNALSSVYFFHDPDLRDRGLGVFSVLKQLEFCRNAGIDYQYLGYWVEGCASMEYKKQFRPYELLQGLPSDFEEPRWFIQNLAKE